MIPKILHFVWVGDESKTPTSTIERWTQLNPDFQVMLWGNKDLSSGWVLAKHMRHFWNRELCGVADCMRWEILYRHGGIALDADLEPSRAIPEWMLEPRCWATSESELLRPGLLSNGAVGAEPQNPFIGQIEEFEVELETIGEIEHFLAYNRAYIRSIEFKGKIVKEEE